MSPHCEQEGRLPGFVPDAEPRVNCPWRGRKGWAASLVTPHTLVDGLVGRSGTGPVSNLDVQIAACVQTGTSACPLQGQWGSGARFICTCELFQHNPPAPSTQLRLGPPGRIWVLLLPPPHPPGSNSVSTPSEAHSHSNASSLAFRMLLSLVQWQPQGRKLSTDVCGPIPSKPPSPGPHHTGLLTGKAKGVPGFLFLRAWVYLKGGLVGHCEAGGGGERGTDALA